MIIARIESAVASARLWLLMRRMNDPTPFYKTWGSIVLRQARANARAKGGRTLWNQIADAVRLKSVSQKGPELECIGLWGRIGMHKERGGPIRVKNKSWLTIPIDDLARGKTVEEVKMSGIKLFRPGRKGAKKNILAYNDNGTLVPVFALCKQTRPQRADKWLPDHRRILQSGVTEAKRYLEN